MTVNDDTIHGGADCPAEGSPRIYVACLAAYNAGRLHGRWIDASQSVDEIQSEVKAILATSPEPLARIIH